MAGWLVLIVGPILGIVVVRLTGLRKSMFVILGALAGQLLVTTLHGQWWKYELAQMEAHPAKNQLVAFIQFQPSLRQRVGSWMILAGIALAVSVLVLLLQRDGGSPPGAESDASR
jgi:hypothetical protein